MINNEENNLKLTHEQLEAIDLANQRLSVIQTETAIATKALNSMRIESQTALKDKTYQEEQLTITIALVATNTSRVNQLNEQIEIKVNELASITQNIAVKADELTLRETSILEKEESLNKLDIRLKDLEKLLTDRSILVLEGEKNLEARITRINEAING